MTTQKLTSTEKKNITSAIDTDIKKGIYEMFPKLKEKLEFIRRKLYAGIYIINADDQLTPGEIRTLLENEYLDKEDYPEY